MGFRRALSLTASIHTERELISAFGPPSGTTVFNNPHDPNDPSFNGSQSAWITDNVFLPPTLPSTLPTKTTLIANRFNTGLFMVSGTLIGYADAHGQILGSSYSVSLSGEYCNQAYLEDLPH